MRTIDKTAITILMLGLVIRAGAYADRTDRERIQPFIDFEYLGAFRLPDETSNGTQWNGGGHGMTFYPPGDPVGHSDGFPGSLFSISHVYQNYVSEFSIPAPYISPTKDTNALPVAVTLQPFTDVADGRQTGGLTGSTTGDIQYFPAQGNQECAKLFWTMYEYYMPPYDACYHGWCNPDFSNLNSVGVWRLGDYPASRTSKYLFEIPAFWADQFVAGRYLGAGRYRTQNGGSMGPCLYACAPWAAGNPPADDSAIEAVELLEYSDYSRPVKGYSYSDEWTDGAWLVCSERSALVLTGSRGYRTRADGTSTYGIPDPDDVGGKGYHAGPYYAAMLFYDPRIIAESAQGTVAPSQVQPYAVFNVHNFLYDNVKCDLNNLGACGYDREHQLFYVIEQDVEGYYRPRKPIIHVFRIRDSGQEPDTQPPLVPANVMAVSTSATLVELIWTASPDDRTNVTYCVFRNDRPVAFTEWTEFADDKVNTEGAYRYQVRAIDTSMNQSDFSETLYVYTPSGADMRPPLIWNVSVAASNDTNVVIRWETDEPADSRVSYNVIYSSPTYYVSNTTLTRNHALTIHGLEANKTYTYYVGSVDAWSNTNAYARKTFDTDGDGRLRNVVPVLDGVGAQRAYAGETVQIDLQAHDQDPADILHFSMSDAPPDAVLDTNTGVFAWATEAGDEGLHPMTFSVTDGRDSDSEEIIIFVYSNTTDRFLLTLECTGPAQGTVSNQHTGSVCIDRIQELLDENTALNLQALPDACSEFAYWNDDPSATNSKYPVTVTNHLTVSARFVYRDSDQDKLPDCWEALYSADGSTTNLPPGEDPDQDGFDNYSEWLAGTSPTSVVSHVALSGSTCIGNGITLQWPSADNRTYRIYFSTHVTTSGAFHLIADRLSATPPENTYTDFLYYQNTKGFYTIRCSLSD